MQVRLVHRVQGLRVGAVYTVRHEYGAGKEYTLDGEVGRWAAGLFTRVPAARGRGRYWRAMMWMAKETSAGALENVDAVEMISDLWGKPMERVRGDIEKARKEMSDAEEGLDREQS